ncbi:MAG TPA: M1 family aminopeptidase [Terriglobales bacterium]|nr:M1 family aminopeptidase [Terriglobales bacterium]
MQFARRPLRRAFSFFFLLLLATGVYAQNPRIQVNDYVIDAEIAPRARKLVAKAKVNFTALDDISVATFELHNGLRPTKIVDADGKTLTAERITQDSTIRIPLPAGLAKGASTTLTISYEGRLDSPDDSPVPGLKLASIGDEEAYLLYAGRWFPVVGYGINRFTATMNITVPSNWTVIGSGLATDKVGGVVVDEAPAEDQTKAAPVLKRGKRAPAPKAKPAAPARTVNPNAKTYTFTWKDRPAFPGTIVAGIFQESKSNTGGVNITAYYRPDKREVIGEYVDTAAKEFLYFSGEWGQPLSTNLKLVQLPDDTVPSMWSTEMVGLSSRAMSGKTNYRLLANAIAHQWWGSSVSPATRADWWMSDGFARFAEARYVENAAGPAAYEEVTKDMQVGALAYDNVPLSGIGRLDPFSPEFQSLATDKGAIILNMLRWVMGDDAFHKTMSAFAQQFAGKSVRVQDFQNLAEQNYGDKLTWFFTQWLDSTGAPEFQSKYTIYRLGGPTCTDPTKCKGFRIVGEIKQDLDLFRMPVEIKVDTDGQSEDKRIEVAGTNSAFTVETFGRPRKIEIDPANRVLKNSPELKLRASILRGQGLVQQGDLAQALEQFQKALEVNQNSSLAHYRIAEVFFLQRNYQASANAYRESLNGDGEPRWTEVWSHIQLGKIFDLTGQRERATNEYRQALQTNDDTQGAQAEARKYLQAPYEPSRSNSSGD